MIPVSLAIITKGRPDKLHNLLQSVKTARFDEIVVVETSGGDPEVERVALANGASYAVYKDPDQEKFEQFCMERGLGVPDHFSDFAAARNYAFSLTKNDWVCWLDSDDHLVRGSLIGAWVERAQESGAEALSCYYLYAKDEHGNVITEQFRERIVKKSSGVWYPFLHELFLNRERPLRLMQVPKEAFHVEHDCVGLHNESSSLRNYRILLYHLDQKTPSFDSRMWKMLGKACVGLSRYEEAIISFKNHLETSEWDIDHFFAYGEMGQCLRALGRLEESGEAELKAIRIAPQFPQGWAGLAQSEMLSRRFPQAIRFAEIGLERVESGENTQVYEYNPSGVLRSLLYTKYKSLSELGRHTESLAILEKLLEAFPNDKEYEKLYKITQETLTDAKLARSFGEAIYSTVQEKDEPRFYAACKSVLPSLYKYAPFEHMGRIEPDRRKHSIAIVCPRGFVRFGPKSLERGIGGSEEAVIHMAPLLAKEGFWVDVFADGDEPGTHGAGENEYRWYPSGAYLPDQIYDTVISWRMPTLFEQPVVARNKVAWQHDVGRPDEWSPKALENITHVLALSKFHRSTFSWVPEDKIVYTRNGLSSDYFSEPKNDPKKVIYASNPTRGLINLLRIWKAVHERTKAELHLFYGFTQWHRRLVANHPGEQKLMREVTAAVHDLRNHGVIDHGMVGQKELAEWTSQCGIAAYPTQFAEISCITLMRYQAMGAVPIYTDYAALSEYTHGVKIPWTPGEEYPHKLFYQKLIEMLENPLLQEEKRSPMIADARKNFLWDSVAKQWKEEFLAGELLGENNGPRHDSAFGEAK